MKTFSRKFCSPSPQSVVYPIWESGLFPPSWREAATFAIPKRGKDSSDPNNYRSIVSTSCPRKTMEMIVNSWLIWVLEFKGLSASEQCGFKKNRSTADHLVRFDSCCCKERTHFCHFLWSDITLTRPHRNRLYFFTSTYSLTTGVAGAPQTTSQPVSSIFPFYTALWNLTNSRPVHSMMSFHLFSCLSCLLPPFNVPCN